MSEEKLSSKKLDIVSAARLSSGEEISKDSYKKIDSEGIGLEVTEETVKNSNMVRENGDSVPDGADEKMLGSDEKDALALKNVEVRFISGDQNQNGDAKIDIGNVEKTFTGMTKEELMKYANDPFWVKLRWVLFIFFWGLWIAMLAGAIAIIVYAPKCAAPTPLVWWKKGPLITISGNEDIERIKEIKDYNSKGVVYELSADETYFVDTEPIEKKIKKLVENFKDLHVVLDLTANYVTKDDELFKQAVEGDPDALSAFVTTKTKHENGWKKVNRNDSAWKQEGSNYFLSQFGDNFDLQMTSLVAQNKLIGVLNHLAGLGVKGFRLINAKHFVINPELEKEPTNSENHIYMFNDYGFYKHVQTINVDGLGDVIHNISRAVHNATNGEGFLTIRDDAGDRADIYKTRKTHAFGFDVPRFVFLSSFLRSSGAEVARLIFNGFENINQTLGDHFTNLWMQLVYKPENFKDGLDATAYNLFMGLLPGVQIVPLEALNYAGNKTALTKKLEEARESQVFQHGKFDYMLSQNETAFGYTRVKSGMPGYFVAINPSDRDIIANFTSNIIGSELSVAMFSDGFPKEKQPRGKILADKIELSKRSVAIFTFVPK